MARWEVATHYSTGMSCCNSFHLPHMDLEGGEVVHYGREGYLAILSSGSVLVLSTIFLLPKVVGVR